MFLYVCFILWGIAVVYVNKMASNFATIRAMRIEDKPLPDLLHDTFPIIHKHVPDYLLFSCISYIVIFNITVSNADIVRLLCTLSLRPIFICLTTFPTCFHAAKEKNKSLYDKMFLSEHDLMFSGHTCCFLFFGSVIGGGLGFGVKFVFPLTLIAARCHYTIDVIVAMLVYHSIPVFSNISV